ncbi:hypothetical protein LCGC14_2380610, partial [marine sediment metagenome]
ALLEPSLSPTKHWFPPASYLQYTNTDHLIELIDTIDDKKIESCAELFSKIVREKYSAEVIYGGMLDKINVAHPFS